MVCFLHLKYIEAIRPKYIEVGSESESPASPAYGYARYSRLLNISVKQTFINLRPLVRIMSKYGEVAISGEILVGFLMGRFGMSRAEAIQNRKENGQDISGLE